MTNNIVEVLKKMGVLRYKKNYEQLAICQSGLSDNCFSSGIRGQWLFHA